MSQYSSCTVFWVDDRFEGKELNSENVWGKVLGAHSDKLFRLMDLDLELASSYEEALANLEKYENAGETGTFLFCILDLIIPARCGTKPEMKYGISLAKQLQNRGVHFVFLSGNTDATSILGREKLNTVPYYIKEPRHSLFQLPDSLVMTLLGEIRRRISWVCMEDIINILHPDSEIRMIYQSKKNKFHDMLPLKYFPFFGNFREFVERCEYRKASMARRSFTIRSNSQHCDLFVQQALLILMFHVLLRQPKKVVLRYGHAHDAAFLRRLRAVESQDFHHGIDVIRVNPEKTSSEQLNEVISRTCNTAQGILIFVIPDDESADLYTDILHSQRLMPNEDLPQIRLEDTSDRTELIHRSSALAFQQWASCTRSSKGHFKLPKGYLSQTKLLINPFNWRVLLESKNVAEALSDPYEVIYEFMTTLGTLAADHMAVLKDSLNKATPIPYNYLLRIGDDTFRNSEFGQEISLWIDGAIDSWLNDSWSFPYGLKSEFIGSHARNLTGSEFKANLMAWEDACFEILVEMLGEYKACCTLNETPTPNETDLLRVLHFIEALGGSDFMKNDSSSVDWEALEFIRWPHLKYPMPSAITRRLREAGRYLWVQPESLDLAPVLPVGRHRYRMLIDTVQQYWSVLTWGREVSTRLPSGWQESVKYLTDTLLKHRLEEAWNQETGKVWKALLCLAKNGCPVSFIVDQVCRNKPLVGGKNSATSFLASIFGYGKILNRLRDSRGKRLGTNLVPLWNMDGLKKEREQLNETISLVIQQAVGNNNWDNWRERYSDLGVAFLELFQALGRDREEHDISEEENFSQNLFNVLQHIDTSDKNSLSKNEGWFIGELLGEKSTLGDFSKAIGLPSMLGTKVDYVWKTLDMFQNLESLSRRYRHYDGYHLLACVNDMRVGYLKDQQTPTPSSIPFSIIEDVFDLFVDSLEGLIAQLAFCARLAGQDNLAKTIDPPGVIVRIGEGVKKPSQEDLGQVLRIKSNKRGWEVFTLGVTGRADKLSYNCDGADFSL